VNQLSFCVHTTIDFILEDLESEVVVPEGLAGIVGVEAQAISPLVPDVAPDEAPMTTALEPDILFSKPANREQYEIATRLAKGKAVLVQGPPGTGKTHTIANLLGYLLAQGKTVLVTAHTTKALRVLRDQVDKALQPLCLSVLGRDSESQTQMKEAAQEIANRLSSSDAATLRKRAALFREQRRKLLDTGTALRRQLRDARFSEVEEIVIGGEGLSPIEVAKRVKSDAQRDGWIPGPLQPGVLCPLTESEVRQLYATNALLAISDERQIAVRQPAVAHLVSAADLEERRARFAGRWRRTVESLGRPQVDSLGSSPERAAQGFAAEIRNRLEWRTTVWEPLTNELRAVAFRWDDWLATHAPEPGDHGELARVQRAASEGLAGIVEAQAALILQAELSTALQSQRTYLAGFPQSDAASVLLAAQDAWDAENYEAACRELARLEGYTLLTTFGRNCSRRLSKVLPHGHSRSLTEKKCMMVLIHQAMLLQPGDRVSGAKSLSGARQFR
jgi:AAA domain